MSDEETNVAEEIQQEANVQPQEMSEENHTTSPEGEASEEPKTYSKDENLIRMRETKEQLERENKELRQYYERHSQSNSAPQEDKEIEIDDDDLVEGKYLKKLQRELNELKKFRSSYEQEKVASIPNRLKSKFDDFEQVVTKENIEKLKQIEPELYSSITAGQDLYAKGVSAYKTLRALGIVKEDKFKDQKNHVQQNHNKPVSTQAIRGQGALSDANIFSKGLTPELKKQLQQEMEESAKSR